MMNHFEHTGIHDESHVLSLSTPADLAALYEPRFVLEWTISTFLEATIVSSFLILRSVMR